MNKEIYAIGDIQGCYDEFIKLLKKIKFDPKQHKLWIAGDLVNRGPKSLKTLRYIKQLQQQGAADVVLGNHDLHLAATAAKQGSFAPGNELNQVLQAKDSAELIDWLCQQPLMQHDQASGFVMSHAGIPPAWSIDEAWNHALEVEKILQDPKKRLLLLENMYGNEPDLWDNTLSGIARQRYIINAFTRMRFVDKTTAALDLKEKNKPGQQDKHLHPWFKSKLRQHHNIPIVFGHWAALELKKKQREKFQVYPIDSGCVWGRQLTALNLTTRKFTRVNSKFSAL